MAAKSGRGQRSGPTRERILSAACEQISADGIDYVRIARIARVAGVSTGSIHYHFDTRETLLAEALRYSYERAGSRRTALIDSARDVTASQRLAEMVAHCLPNPGVDELDWVLWVELWLRAIRHPELRPVAEELYARLHVWFAEAISVGVESGEFERCDVDRVADLALALIDGYGHRALWGDGGMPLAAAREQIDRVLARELGVDVELAVR